MFRRASKLVRQESLTDFEVMVSPFEETREDAEPSAPVIRLKPRAPQSGLLGLLLGTATR